jgi:hypothetical protein
MSKTCSFALGSTAIGAAASGASAAASGAGTAGIPSSRDLKQAEPKFQLLGVI